MSYRSNAAEAWYPDPQSTKAQNELPLDLLPPASLTQPLWRSLVGNLRDTLAPEKLPPLVLTSRPVNVGLRCGFEFLVVSEEQRLLLRQVFVVLANAST